MTTHQTVKINAKTRMCIRNGTLCKHNDTSICNGCAVLAGNQKKPVLFESSRK
jgi:hypothetical protein